MQVKEQDLEWPNSSLGSRILTGNEQETPQETESEAHSPEGEEAPKNIIVAVEL